MLWPVLGVGQLDADLLDQEAGPVCPTATQVSGLAEENGILLLYWPALLLFVCFFFLFFSILGLGWLLCSCSPVLPNFMKSSLKVFQLTHFCWEVLCPAVSSIHFLLPILLFHGSIHDPIHITNLGENDLWRDPFLLSATVSLEISLVAQGTVPGASRYLILLTLRLTAKFHLT